MTRGWLPLGILALAAIPASGWHDAACVPVGAPQPPGQPTGGPGGADYTHGAVQASLMGVGAELYWLLEPADPVPAEGSVVVFFHGFGAASTSFYRGWLDHLVLHGNVVVFPLYQAGAAAPADYTDVGVRVVRAAYAELQNGLHVRPAAGGFAVTGHSAGGVLAANVAGRAVSEGLAFPLAVLPVEPGDGTIVVIGDLAGIPASTLLVAVAGEEDTNVGQEPAREIYRRATEVPPDGKDFVLARSDYHGCPQLTSDHGAPFGGSRPPVAGTLADALFERSALDYYGWWKLFDALHACARSGVWCDAALGDTSAQRFMGVWSDGVPVVELDVSDL